MTPSLLVATAVADTLVAGLIFPEFGMGGVLGCTLFDHDCGFLSEGQQEDDYGSLCYYQRLAYFSWLLIRASMLLVLVAHRVKSGRSSSLMAKLRRLGALVFTLRIFEFIRQRVRGS